MKNIAKVQISFDFLCVGEGASKATERTSKHISISTRKIHSKVKKNEIKHAPANRQTSLAWQTVNEMSGCKNSPVSQKLKLDTHKDV